MISQDEQREIRGRADLGRKLIENDDVREFLSNLNKEYDDLWVTLRDTATIDPVIAELQGRLRTLESVVKRPLTWIQRAADLNKNRLGENNRLDSEDLDRG